MKVLVKWSSYDNMFLQRNLPYLIPLVLGTELEHIQKSILNKHLSGDGLYSNKCARLLEKMTGSKMVVMTTSCTDALEMTAILANIEPGDEVIMSSFNFVSAANAFVLRGASIKFVDIDPDTMNIDANKIEQAITEKTKVILAMHYGGVACDMTKIMSLANQYNLLVVEDAAHCLDAYHESTHLGSIGHLGVFSFHETKNIQCGEGGALLINDAQYMERANILKDKGTNRALFQQGIVQKYTWVDVGSSYTLGELNAAFLYAQLLSVKEVSFKRKKIWNEYYNLFSKTDIECMINENSNAHIYYIKLKNNDARKKVVSYLKENQISAVSHYEPLHSSLAGKKYSSFVGQDNFTTSESQRLLRLPIYFDMNEDDVVHIFSTVCRAYGM
ncbi:MAG: dTDP-4-amino-4,6-dideoxygalactose transaminase [Saprospiraceae bacterium]